MLRTHKYLKFGHFSTMAEQLIIYMGYWSGKGPKRWRKISLFLPDPCSSSVHAVIRPNSSSVFLFLQSMLGIYPYAPLHLLFVDPHLPEWLPEITLHHLQIGQAWVTLHFYREADGTSNYHVMDQEGKLKVVRQPSPWSLTTSFGEWLRDILESFID